MRKWTRLLLISTAAISLFTLWSLQIVSPPTSISPTLAPTIEVETETSASKEQKISRLVVENDSPHYWSAHSPVNDEAVKTNLKLRADLWRDAFGSPSRRNATNDYVDAIASIRQCRALGAEAVGFISLYLHRHHNNGLPSRLIYSCESNKRKHFCGGMGDRLRGIISTFYMALLSNRRFELYSPVPIPMQKYLKPHLVNWIPSAAEPFSSDQGLADIRTHLSTIHSDLSMMMIKKHSTYLRKLDSSVQSLDANAPKLADLRLQTNSVGVDMFLSSKMTPNLHRNKVRMFDEGQGVAFPESSIEYLMDPSDREHVSALNISSYFGCLYEVLFMPSEELLRAGSETVGGRYGVTKAFKDSSFSDIRNHLKREAYNVITSSKHKANEDKLNHVLRSNWDSLVFGAPTWLVDGNTMLHRRSVYFLSQPYVSVQVRVGGPLATGMKEPYRTPPEAFGEFFAVLDSLRKASMSVSNGKQWDFFVSSDAEAFINLTIARFSGNNLRVNYVRGKEAFLHTDTLNLGDIDAAKWKHLLPQTIENAFFLTLLNNFLLGLGSHMVMAQSGFGDTAYWRMRRDASCLFVDMTNLKHAWQHHLGYLPSTSSPPSGDLLTSRLRLTLEEGFTSARVPKVGFGRSSARALRNRVIYLPEHTSRNSSFYD
eukprot:GILI01029582.1.p1 GENE.GILI01029582.1~~GILI01029582.1.p1  ORF type:complete len:655 (+),score=35.65 GILI01029582.1:23-1987(+)